MRVQRSTTPHAEPVVLYCGGICAGPAKASMAAKFSGDATFTRSAAPTQEKPVQVNHWSARAESPLTTGGDEERLATRCEPHHETSHVPEKIDCAHWAEPFDLVCTEECTESGAFAAVESVPFQCWTAPSGYAGECVELNWDCGECDSVHQLIVSPEIYRNSTEPVADPSDLHDAPPRWNACDAHHTGCVCERGSRYATHLNTRT